MPIPHCLSLLFLITFDFKFHLKCLENLRLSKQFEELSSNCTVLRILSSKSIFVCFKNYPQKDSLFTSRFLIKIAFLFFVSIAVYWAKLGLLDNSLRHCSIIFNWIEYCANAIGVMDCFVRLPRIWIRLELALSKNRLSKLFVWQTGCTMLLLMSLAICTSILHSMCTVTCICVYRWGVVCVVWIRNSCCCHLYVATAGIHPLSRIRVQSARSHESRTRCFMLKHRRAFSLPFFKRKISVFHLFLMSSDGCLWSFSPLLHNLLFVICCLLFLCHFFSISDCCLV